MTNQALRWLHFGRATSNESRATTGGNGAGSEPVCIGSVEGPLRAEIARTFLEQAGITVHLRAETVSSLYGFVSGPLGVVQLWVPASEADEAAQLFDELDFGDA